MRDKHRPFLIMLLGLEQQAQRFGMFVGIQRRFMVIRIGAITLSFLFYIPVAVGASLVPMLGMMMLPKTVCYMILIWVFWKYAAGEAE